MPENLRAVVAVLILAIPVLWWLRPQLTAAATWPDDYKVRAGLWIALTLALFLAHNFWLFVLIVTVALLTAGRKDSNPLGLYFFLLLLAPPFESAITGIPGINYLLGIDYLRVLSIVVLLPVTVQLWRDPASPRIFKMPADKYVLGYIVLLLLIQSQVTSSTDLMRSAVSHFIDIYLPYYAFSRGLVHFEKLRDTLAAFTAACAMIAIIAVFETLKGWLLYASLPTFMDVQWSFGGYMFRTGSLRASVSTGHSIILGYVMTVAFGLHLALRSSYPSARAWTIVLLLLGAGIVASFSRGPWVGAAAMVLVAIALAPKAGSKVAKLVLAAVLLVPVLMVTPWADKIVSILPFVGEVDDGSIDYRQQLFMVSWDVLMLNPLLGSPHYMTSGSLEQLRQGEGIVDMVNSYLGIAMFSGFVGLAIFLGVFLSSAARLFLRLVRDPYKDDESYAMGLALFATLVGVLVAIATLSSINAVPVVYWCLAGACAAYLHGEQAERLDASWQPPEPPAGLSAAHVR